MTVYVIIIRSEGMFTEDNIECIYRDELKAKHYCEQFNKKEKHDKWVCKTAYYEEFNIIED